MTSGLEITDAAVRPRPLKPMPAPGMLKMADIGETATTTWAAPHAARTLQPLDFTQ